MIMLNADEKDALIEVCNVGMSKAAKQLSILLDESIHMSIPNIELFQPDSKQFDLTPGCSLAFVSQELLGDLCGRMVLIFGEEQTQKLTEIVIGNPCTADQSNSEVYTKEAMMEIGNIIISSCVSAIANMLKVGVNLSLPKYNILEMELLIENELKKTQEGASDTFVIRTNLDTANESISGYLVLVLSEKAVNILFDKVNSFLDSI